MKINQYDANQSLETTYTRVRVNVLTVDSRYNNYLLYSHDITQIRNIRRAIFLFCYRRNNETKIIRRNDKNERENG